MQKSNLRPVIGSNFTTKLGFSVVNQPVQKIQSAPISISLMGKPVHNSVLIPNTSQSITSFDGSSTLQTRLTYLPSSTVDFNNASVVNFTPTFISTPAFDLTDATTTDRTYQIVSKKVYASSTGLICQIAVPTGIDWCVTVRFFGQQNSGGMKFIKGEVCIFSNGTSFYGVVNRTSTSVFGIPTISLSGSTLSLQASNTNSGSIWVVLAEGVFYSNPSSNLVIS